MKGIQDKDAQPMDRIRSQAKTVKSAEGRTTVQARFPDARIFEGPVGTPLAEFVRAAEKDPSIPVVAALVDGKLRELSCPVERDSNVAPVSITATDGLRIYQRALSFLLVVAAHELFPAARVVIDHSLTLSGLYCEVRNHPPLTARQVRQLEDRMREIVQADEPIVRHCVPLDEAREIFRRQGYDDKVSLLRFRQKNHLVLYELRGLYDYYYGHMVPSAGYLEKFGLSLCPPGLILLFPRREAPTALPILREHPRLAGVFQEYEEWLDLLSVGDVGGLNEAIQTGRMPEVILVAEALHDQRIAEIAREITQRHDRARLVLIAGPSSSGKTTLAKRLAIQLIANGVRPLHLAIDDYFVAREETPKDCNGDYDFECLQAVDLELLDRHVTELLAGRRVRLPHYDFAAGNRVWGREVSISKDQIILAEGIHGLNPELLPNLPRENVYRLYVSALTQLNIDHHNRVPTTDTRLLRRMVRDSQYRGYSAGQTIQRWDSVTQGERRNIFPYQELADAMFNSALAYELAVLKPFAAPLLAQIEPGGVEYIEARRLLAFLDWFLPWPPDAVPGNSLLREFIGGSSLREFVP
jgi:uridine kinase